MRTFLSLRCHGAFTFSYLEHYWHKDMLFCRWLAYYPCYGATWARNVLFCCLIEVIPMISCFWCFPFLSYRMVLVLYFPKWPFRQLNIAFLELLIVVDYKIQSFIESMYWSFTLGDDLISLLLLFSVPTPPLPEANLVYLQMTILVY